MKAAKTKTAITSTVKGVRLPKDATLVAVKGKSLPDYRGRITVLLSRVRSNGSVKLPTLLKGQPSKSRALYLLKALLKGGFVAIKKTA
jgi:hypothetical protein